MWITWKCCKVPTCRCAKIWCICIKKIHFFPAFGVWLLSIWSKCQHADMPMCNPLIYFFQNESLLFWNYFSIWLLFGGGLCSLAIFGTMINHNRGLIHVKYTLTLYQNRDQNVKFMPIISYSLYVYFVNMVDFVDIHVLGSDKSP